LFCCGDKDESQAVQIRWQVLAMPAIEVSSSSIRWYCSQGRSIGHLVPEAIETYIMTKKMGYKPRHKLDGFLLEYR